jgi:hypothetical protein
MFESLESSIDIENHLSIEIFIFTTLMYNAGFHSKPLTWSVRSSAFLGYAESYLHKLLV